MTNDSAHYTIPREPGRIEAVVLAVLMHALLFTFLWIGINWVSQTPQSIDPDYVVTQQELDVQQPQPEPVPVPTPKVEDRTPPVPDADIATAQEKKRLKQEKEEQEKIAQQKKLDEQRKQEELDKQKAKEEADKKREEEKEKEKEKKLAEKKEQQEEQKRMQKLRDEERARITREAGGNPGTGSPSAPGKPGGNGAWIGKVQAKIKSLIVFNAPPGADQNATAQFAVSLLPDGSVASVKLTSSSGNPAWDDAVKRAIENAAPYPFDSATGSVPRQFTSSNRLGDQK